MLPKIFIFALAAVPFVSAHGRVDVVKGDAGGNGTALGIKGAVVPLTGSNSKTEVDTTVFKSKTVASDGLGKTKGTGSIDTSLLAQTMTLSGSTLPQVKSSLSGTWHVVTSDGFGAVKAVLDPTATGKFSNGTQLETTKDVPGDNGDAPKSKRSVLRRFAESTGLIQKRAHNINQDFPMAFAVPAGTTCSGSVAGQDNVCLVKIANENGNGPFGGVVAIQMASGASNSTAKARSFHA